MRKLLLLLLATFPLLTRAQSTFEDLSLPSADTFYVNYTMPGKDVGIDYQGTHYPCVYDTVYGGIWESGFALSNKTDSVAVSYINQYSAKPGAGSGGSSKYLVAHGESNFIKRKQDGFSLFSFDVANSTFAYSSMKNGDQFSKKFGGATGNDPDWYKVTVRGYQSRGATAMLDSVDVYLADLRSPDNTKDTILKGWKHVTMPRGFVRADSITFTLSSSDTGSFGINTPLYFCLDNVYFIFPESVAQPAFADFATISPNPASDILVITLKGKEAKEAALLDMTGRTIAAISLTSARTILNTASLPAGRYILRLKGDRLQTSTSFIRR